MGKDDTLSVSDHEAHSNVFTQEEGVTWNMARGEELLWTVMVYYT